MKNFCIYYFYHFSSAEKTKTLVSFLPVFLTIVFTWIALPAVGQHRIYRNYATQKVQQRLLMENPAMRENLHKIELHIQQVSQEELFRKDTIPVVFHIFISPDQDYPREDQVYAQLDMLNRDFGSYAKRQKSYKEVHEKVRDFVETGQDMDIYFCLPKTGRTAIQFIPTDVKVWQTDDAIKSSKRGGSDPWDTYRYLNVWVAHLSIGNSGYAQIPGGPAQTDGIVIDYDFFGNEQGTAVAPYNEGKTLTHLVGSYLGLYELWNELEPCGDDHVEDTPIHNAPNYGIGTSYYHVSTCQGKPTEMIINFMDNTDDEALNMFTEGQKERVKAILSRKGPRSDLRTSETICQESLLTLRSSGEGKWNLEQNTFRLYPNPASREVTLEIKAKNAGSANVRIFNALGSIAFIEKYLLTAGTQQFRLDCSGWPSNLFFVQTTFDDGTLVTQILALER